MSLVTGKSWGWHPDFDPVFKIFTFLFATRGLVDYVEIDVLPHCSKTGAFSKVVM